VTELTVRIIAHVLVDKTGQASLTMAVHVELFRRTG